MKQHPVNKITDTIEFLIPGTQNEAIDMNNISLYIRGKLTKADGSALVAASDAAPVNNFLHSLFEDVEVHVNGCLINKKTSTYAHAAMLYKLTQVDIPHENMGWLALEGFYPNAAGDPAVATNKGFIARKKIVAVSREFELVGTPQIDLFHSSQALPPGCDLRVILYMHKPEFYLVDRVGTVKLTISEANLYVRKVTLSDTLLSSIRSIWQTQEIVLPFTRREVYKFSIPTGVSNHVEQNALAGRLPVRLFVALVNNAAFIGSRTTSPFYFIHHNVSKISVAVNDHPMGYGPEEVAMTNYSRSAMAYRFFLECIGAVGERALSTPITYANYIDGSTIFAFSRAPDLCHGEHALPDATGIVKVELNFSTATTAALTLLIMAEYDSSISIDNHNNVTTTYSV